MLNDESRTHTHTTLYTALEKMRKRKIKIIINYRNENGIYWKTIVGISFIVSFQTFWVILEINNSFRINEQLQKKKQGKKNESAQTVNELNVNEENGIYNIHICSTLNLFVHCPSFFFTSK